jgi:glycosyltransferase involved in cell wall biosynthesis
VNVLYISKALVVAAYRDKLRSLSAHVRVKGIIPDRWGRDGYEPILGGGADVQPWPVRFHGHNHMHLYRSVTRLIEDSRADVVHIDEEPYSAVTWQLARACHRHGVPSLFFAWQNLDKRLPPPFGAIRGYVFRHAAGGIAGTEAAAEVLRNAGYTGRLAVIPQMGVDAGRFRPDPAAKLALRRRLGGTGDEIVIGYGGRLVPEKGVHLLIRALAGLPDVRLLILGDGPERHRLEEQAVVEGVEKRVIFTGLVASTEMPRWLAALDVLALPTVGRPGWTEQFGRILIEAMSCGVAVIGSRNGEIPHVIGEAGVAVEPGDEQALTEALRVLVGNAELRMLLGERARTRALERFTNDRIAADTARFYRSIIGRSA